MTFSNLQVIVSLCTLEMCKWDVCFLFSYIFISVVWTPHTVNTSGILNSSTAVRTTEKMQNIGG